MNFGKIVIGHYHYVMALIGLFLLPATVTETANVAAIAI